jgi:single-strand DNA-binding protein
MKTVVNQVQLIGRLGADAEIRTTKQGVRVGTLRLATNERTKLANGEWKETTQWHQCVIWGEMNKVVEKYGKKGNQLLVLGSLSYREYVVSSDVKRQTTEIRVNEILVLKSQSGASVDIASEEAVDYDAE